MNKEGQTQEPVKVFIADFKNKVLREKYSLDKEEFELMLRRKHGNFWNDYYRENEEKYIASLKQYPATWLTPEMDGREMIKYVDFEVDPYFNNAYPLKAVATTQEPVGGMKDEIISKRYDEFFGDGYWEREYKKHIVLFARGCVEALTPPPAPIKTEGEDEFNKAVEKAWEMHSRGIPEDSYTLEEYAELVAGKEIMFMGDFIEACHEYLYLPAPPSPVGIDVEELAKKLYPNIMINECTGPIDFDKRNVAQKALRNAFKAGYAASLPQSSTEEEKDLLKEVINLVQEYELNTMGRNEFISNLLSTYKISKR